MDLTEDIVTIEHNGQKYSAKYTVESKCVTVYFKNNEGNLLKNSILIGNSPAEAIARMLLRKMVVRES